jgi:hypothetical protein
MDFNICLTWKVRNKRIYNSGDVRDAYERTFQIEYSVLGTTTTYDLKPNGADIELTNENRKGIAYKTI